MYRDTYRALSTMSAWPIDGTILFYQRTAQAPAIDIATRQYLTNVGHLPSGQMLSGQKPSGYMPSGH